MDNLTREQRHKNMSNIRSRNTKPERLLMQALKKRGIYFTRHRKDVPGKPDIVFKRKKIAVFVDSDFWHCNPDTFRLLKSNEEYWSKKISGNIHRDYKVNEELSSTGWKILRLWESDVLKNTDSCRDAIIELIGTKQAVSD